jgi:hypothetical protein
MLKVSVLLTATLLMASPSLAGADPELRVKMRMEEVHENHTLGTVDVPGVGEVSLVARRKGLVIELIATGPGGAPIGRSETTVGLSESPIYVRTPDGLTKISVVWNSPD